MAALFVWVVKNDPMINDVTIGKPFTNGASVYHSDWEGRGVGQGASSTAHKKTRRGAGWGLSLAGRIRAEMLTNIFEFTEANAAVAAYIHWLVMFVDKIVAIYIMNYHAFLLYQFYTPVNLSGL